MKKNKGMTAGELLDKLNDDQSYLGRKASANAILEEKAARLRSAERPLIQELGKLNVNVLSIWDIVNTHKAHPNLIALLVAHLQMEYPPEIREGIARALATPEASPFWGTLLKLYADENDARVKNGLAIALSGSSNHNHKPQILGLLHDKANGTSRAFFLRLFKPPSQKVNKQVLLKLLCDPDLSSEVRAILDGCSE